MPKVEQLESHLADKILEQEAIKKELEKLRTDEEIQVRTIQQKHELDLQRIREETNQQFKQIMSMIQQNPVLVHVKPDVLRKKNTH